MTNNEAVVELQRLAEIEHKWHYQTFHEQGGDATYPVSFCDAISVSMVGVTSPTGKKCTCGAADHNARVAACIAKLRESLGIEI